MKISKERMKKNLENKFIRMFRCDTARISCPGETMFLIIGHKRNTKDAPGQWVDENGNHKDWEYTAEQVVASGKTEKELINSAKCYKILCKMTMEDYLKNISKEKNENK